MNSTTKKILAIIASAALPAFALAAPGGGGAAIGPVNGSGTQEPQTTAQKTTLQQTNTGWPLHITLIGTPVEPSRLSSSIAQNTWASARRRSSVLSLTRLALIRPSSALLSGGNGAQYDEAATKAVDAGAAPLTDTYTFYNQLLDVVPQGMLAIGRTAPNAEISSANAPTRSRTCSTGCRARPRA